MARQFSIRCKTESGTFLIDELNDETTIGELKVIVCEKIFLGHVLPASIRILCGYPPRAVAVQGNVQNDGIKLRAAGISSAETIHVVRISGLVPAVGGGDASPRAGFSGMINLSSMDYGRPSDSSGFMLRYSVPSNNSCLFTSILYLLNFGIEDAQRSVELRQLISSIVASNPERYTTAFLGMSNDDYCNWIENTDHWGGGIELAILSEHFQLEICAVDSVNLRMHRFGENRNYRNRIFLIYDGIHYDPLRMEYETGRIQTVFNVDYEEPLNMAMEIAREAHTSRQFTDTANFRLICQVCKEKVKGDKEARTHAIATGHVKFDEIHQ